MDVDLEPQVGSRVPYLVEDVRVVLYDRTPIAPWLLLGIDEATKRFDLSRRRSTSSRRARRIRTRLRRHYGPCLKSVAGPARPR